MTSRHYKDLILGLERTHMMDWDFLIPEDYEEMLCCAEALLAKALWDDREGE